MQFKRWIFAFVCSCGELPRGPARREDEFLGLVLTTESIVELSNRETNPFSNFDRAEPNARIAAEFGRQIDTLEAQIAERTTLSKRAGIELPLDQLAHLFALTPFEQFCVVTALAPELDCKYERLFAFLQDDVTRKKPSVELATDLLAAYPREKLDLRQAFDPRGSLIRYHILEFPEDIGANRLPLPSRSFKLDDRICDFLLGQRQIDARIESFAQLTIPVADPQSIVADDVLASQVVEFVRASGPDPSRRSRAIVFSLSGPPGTGKRSLVHRVCSELRTPLLLCDAAKLLSHRSASGDCLELMSLLRREALLQRSALCLADVDPLLELVDAQHVASQSIADALCLPDRPTFLTAHEGRTARTLFADADIIEIPFEIPDDRSRFVSWKNALCDPAILGATPVSVSDSDLASLAGRFRITPGNVRRAASEAVALTRWRGQGDGVSLADLAVACRSLSISRFGTLATRIVPTHGWSDLVLPADATKQLREIVDQIKYRYRVFSDWGFEQKLSRGKGLSALFSGPPGVGKTLAVEIIAGAVGGGMDLYRIDVSQVVSKYIGETEKNLRRVFDEAKNCHAILFFDEADTIFARRSEVKDAHDRYANLETGYLLQQMEEYEGVAILATNLRKNIDTAFTRRLQHIVDFPFPGTDQRRQIWKVTFPGEAPLGDDVDFDVLAEQIKLAGGNIKNIAVAAAFFAAADAGKSSRESGESHHPEIRMSHLLSAARREYQKVGMLWTEPPPTQVRQTRSPEARHRPDLREAQLQ